MRRETLAVVATLALAALVAATLGLSLGAGVAGAVHEQPDRSLFAVLLEADGDAEVVHVTSYDLSEANESEAFEELQANETRQEAHRDEVLATLEEEAARSQNETGREMRVHDGSIEVSEVEDGDDTYGRVEVRARWDGLAAADDDRVVVTEPFAGGYDPGRDVVVHAPEDYRRGNTSPSPYHATADSAAWSPGTVDLSGFAAEFVTADAQGTPEDPGFAGYRAFLGAAALAALPVVAVLAALYRRDSL